MTIKLFSLVLLAVLQSSTTPPDSNIPQAHYGSHQILPGSVAQLPDSKVTPGVADPDAVADLTKKPHMINHVERNICVDDFPRRTDPLGRSEKMPSVTSRTPDSAVLNSNEPQRGQIRLQSSLGKRLVPSKPAIPIYAPPVCQVAIPSQWLIFIPMLKNGLSSGSIRWI
jgi:hypothetical protein